MDQTNNPFNSMSTPSLSFSDAVRSAFQNYCNFSGRATRAEYWWFALFCVIVGLVFAILGQMASFFSYVGGIVNLALFLPGLGLAWRRLHDIGKAGGWYFIVFIPIVGFIIMIIWLCKPSEPFANRFGEVPAAA